MQNNKILVTKTFLPPIEEYIGYLKRSWNKRWITNNGELALELEDKLKNYLNVKHAYFVSNGTLALQLAIKSLDLSGEIITTPFTFAATTTAIIWEKCKPVFVDINPDTFTIDADKIEQAITSNTQAILAVHVYGYPCEVEKIEAIAKKHNLKVIYDAAHAFGVKIGDKSIFEFGDISILSLHATKLFHTVEGGLITTNNDDVAKKIELFRDFGLEGENVIEAGINAKNSEFHAAMGLTNLNHLPEILSLRKTIIGEYKDKLKGTGIHNTKYFDNVLYNYAYFPVVFKSEQELLNVKENLAKENISARRYFYPSLNTLPFVPYVSCPISESIAKKVLCLPLYHDLQLEEVRRIAEIIKNTIFTSLPTVAVGIPAYNEEANIENLIQSVISQKQTTFTLKEIIINSDASSDTTVAIVNKLAKNDRRIRLVVNCAKMGKPYRLNELYKLHDSDYLLTLDADVLLQGTNVIENMLHSFRSDPQTVAAAGHLTPVKPDTFTGKIMYTNNILWNLIRENINNGDHIANLYGAATMLKKDFSKSFTYPEDISCDEEYLYIIAKQKNGFSYAKDSIVLFKSPETLKEVISQGKRALRERNLLVKYFGKEILRLHHIPLKYKIMGTMKMFLKTPFYTLLALLFNIFIRLSSHEDSLNKRGMWEIATSTKSIKMTKSI
jgi:dTDP-4-amino-4,6-dideoxygalactose transaminase/glycosyltransferase involved in cell wall biosynthesis